MAARLVARLAARLTAYGPTASVPIHSVSLSIVQHALLHTPMLASLPAPVSSSAKLWKEISSNWRFNGAINS